MVLLITPTIERNLDLPGSHVSTIEMGSDDLTGDSIQLRDLQRDEPGSGFTAPALAPPAHFLTGRPCCRHRSSMSQRRKTEHRNAAPARFYLD